MPRRRVGANRGGADSLLRLRLRSLISKILKSPPKSDGASSPSSLLRDAPDQWRKDGSVLRGCRMHQFAQVILKLVSISEDPQARKEWESQIGRTIAETFVSSGRLLLSRTRPTQWTGVCIATFSLIASRYVQPGLFKSLVWVVEEGN